MTDKSQLIEAGRVINTHGIAGEVKIEVWLDSPSFMKGFKRFFIDENEYSVLSSRIQKKFLIVKLKDIADVNSAILLKNKTVYINRHDVKLPKGSFFLCDIIGSDVYDEAGNQIGVLTEIIENPAQMIYVVNGEREHLIPAVDEFILKTDVQNRIISVHLIDGM